MKINELIEAFRNGAKIKRKDWLGYWQLVDGKIKLFCKDGRVLGFDSLDDEIFTINNIVADDWEIVDEGYIFPLTHTYTFGEAIRFLKQGKKVAREGWNGKGMFLWLKQEVMVKSEWCKDEMLKDLVDQNGGEILGLGTICMYTTDSTGRRAILTGWLASQSDMLCQDWVLVKEEPPVQGICEPSSCYSDCEPTAESVCNESTDEAQDQEEPATE